MHWRDRVGTERSRSIFADPSPGAGSAGTSRRKVPLSENSLLRKEDLGLTLTEMGLEKPVQTSGSRKNWWGLGKGVRTTVETSLVLSETGRVREAQQCQRDHSEGTHPPGHWNNHISSLGLGFPISPLASQRDGVA